MKKLLLICLLLCGCSSFGKGIVEGILGRDDYQEYKPECLIWSDGFPGIKTNIKTTKIMLTHGIGNHLPGHSTAFMLELTKRMGMDKQDRNYKQINMKSQDGQDVGTLRIYRFSNSQTNQEVIFYEQTWGTLTAPDKERLIYDINREYSASRASMNNSLKRLVDQTIPDPMIYLGPKGDLILKSTVQSFCWMTSYDYNELNEVENRACLEQGAHILSHLDNDNFTFITASLGSRIVIDSLQYISEKLEDLTEKQRANQILKTLQQKEITIYMLANQLPLLQMGRKLPAHIGQIPCFCREGGTKYEHRLFQKLNIVAFSDPNDLLSFSLTPDAGDSYIDSSLCPNISNVSVVTNKPTDLLGVGQISNPLKAHTNYQKDPIVLDLIVNGLSEKNQYIKDICRWVDIDETDYKQKNACPI